MNDDTFDSADLASREAVHLHQRLHDAVEASLGEGMGLPLAAHIVLQMACLTFMHLGDPLEIATLLRGYGDLVERDADRHRREQQKRGLLYH